MNRYFYRWVALGCCGLAVACGPSIEEPGSAESDSSGADTGMSTSPPSTSTTATPPPPATTGGDDFATTAVDSSTGGGVTFIEPTGSCGDSEWSYHCSFECTPLADDCPQDERCMPWANDGGDAWNSTRCSPIDPQAAAIGEPCSVEGNAVSGIDSCGLDAMCWGVDAKTLMGTCRAMCAPTDDTPDATCEADQQCVAFNEGQLPICVPPCNPLAETPCEDPGEICRFTEQGMHCLPEQGGIVVGSGMQCGGEPGCDPGFACLSDPFVNCEAGECCTPFCDLDDPTANDQCAAIDPSMECLPAVDRTSNVGVCAMP